MGKTSKFFLSLLGFKTYNPPTSRDKQLKRRWSFVKSRKGNSSLPGIHQTSNSLDGHECNNLNENEESNKRAIALVAATAAVVDAAVAAAQAAKEVVRITSSGRYELAAIRIQSCFRAYLARRALRALKALVRLQALVRGHILRKQTADMMRRLQALIRAQARARALRSQFSDPTTTNKPVSHSYHNGPPTPEKFEHLPHTKHDHRSIYKRNGSKTYVRGITNQERTILEGSTDHTNDKIVEVDTGEQYHVTTKGRKLYQPDQASFGYSHSITTSRGSTFQPTSSSPCASCEVNSFDDSIRGGVSNPIKSDGPRSCNSGFSDHPNYMANTESSRAKVRSLSAPRLRTQLEINATKKDFGYKYGSGMQRVPTLRDSFAKKAYQGSGRLDRLGVPVYDTEESEFCVGYWN